MPMHPENRKQWDSIFGPAGGDGNPEPKGEVDCPFCMIILNNEYMAISRKLQCVVIKPRDPVVLGHILVVPIGHARDASDDPQGAANAMYFAAELIRDEGYDANIITSIGPEATQTVFHTHIHVVPRKRGDGLALPWTGQKKSALTWKNDPPSGQEVHIHGGDPGPDGVAMRSRMIDRQRRNLYDGQVDWNGR